MLSSALQPIASFTSEDFAAAAPAQEPSVVHSSFGRLRVHLPHWSGQRGADIVAKLQQLAGVTHAEANPLTGNVLLLFQPGQTTAQALFEALPALRLGSPAQATLLEEKHARPPALTGEIRQEQGRYQGEASTYMTGLGRVVYKALGWGSVGMAVVGAILPGIPTAPFVLLAGYFFIRSSPEAHQWLRQSRWFGPILRDWEEHRGVRRSVRNAALGLIVASMAITSLVGLPTFLLATILSLQIVGLAIVLSLRVVEPSALTAPSV